MTFTSAGIILINKNTNNVLVIKEKRGGVVGWNIPMGRKKNTDTCPLETAFREFNEETRGCIDISKLLKNTTLVHRDTKTFVYMIECNLSSLQEEEIEKKFLSKKRGDDITIKIKWKKLDENLGLFSWTRIFFHSVYKF